MRKAWEGAVVVKLVIVVVELIRVPEGRAAVPSHEGVHCGKGVAEKRMIEMGRWSPVGQTAKGGRKPFVSFVDMQRSLGDAFVVGPGVDDELKGRRLKIANPREERKRASAKRKGPEHGKVWVVGVVMMMGCGLVCVVVVLWKAREMRHQSQTSTPSSKAALRRVLALPGVRECVDVLQAVP